MTPYYDNVMTPNQLHTDYIECMYSCTHTHTHTHTGTPFQIRLPQSTLHPQFSLTPPPQTSTLKAAQQTVSEHQFKSTRSDSNSSDVPMISPSELDTSVFKSPTPSDVSECQNQETRTSNSKCRDSNLSNGAQTSDTKVDGDTGTNANDIAISSADDWSAIESPVKATKAVENGNKSASNIQVADTSVQPNVSRQVSSTSRLSSRMCLSLNKVKASPSSARRSLILKHTRSDDDKNISDSSKQFELCVGANEDDLGSSVESQFHLPTIDVPTDSQFELSGDSQSLFQIQNPSAAEPLVQPPVSASRKRPKKQGGSSSTLFAFVSPSQSSLQAIKKAKGNNPPNYAPRPQHELLPSCEDPYEYNSPNVDAEVDFILQKTQRAASGPGPKKLRKVCSESTSTAKNPKESSGHEEGKSLENAPRYSSEPPSSSTAVVKPHCREAPPSSLGSSQNGGQQAPPELQSAADATSDASNPRAILATSPPPADNPISKTRSPFLTPSLTSPSTSSFAPPLPLISPSAAVPKSMIDKLKRQAGLEKRGDYQLKLVKIIRTVVEERHVFCEDVQQGHVVRNSGRSWIVSRRLATCLVCILCK